MSPPNPSADWLSLKNRIKLTKWHVRHLKAHSEAYTHGQHLQSQLNYYWYNSIDIQRQPAFKPLEKQQIKHLTLLAYTNSCRNIQALLAVKCQYYTSEAQYSSKIFKWPSSVKHCMLIRSASVNMILYTVWNQVL